MKLITDFVTFRNQMVEQMESVLQIVWKYNIPKAQEKLKDYTKEYLEGVDFLYNIQTRDRVTALVGEFGIPYGEEVNAVDDIIETIINRLNCRINILGQKGTTLRTQISITLDDIVLLELEDLPAGATLTEKGDIIKWLYNSLFSGSEIIVTNFHVEYMVGQGRSGLAIMAPGGSWTVSSEYQGTRENNWLTRALRTEDYLDTSAKLVFNTLNRE